MATRLASTTGIRAPAGAADVSPRTVTGGGLRLLLAEDNPIAAELLRLMGRRLGARIDWVENGLDAVDAVLRARQRGAPYALLLMDAMMPVLSGTEATRRLRASGVSPCELPIIAVTAATAPDEVREFFEAGMQAYLAKPVSITDLSACIDAWVPRHQAQGTAVFPDTLVGLHKRYALRKAEVFAQLEEAIASGPCPLERGEELRNQMHKLAGTAGSFGEDELSKAAGAGASLVAGAEGPALDRALREALALLNSAS